MQTSKYRKVRVFYDKYKPWSIEQSQQQTDGEELVPDELIDVLYENIRISFEEDIAKKLLSFDVKK